MSSKDIQKYIEELRAIARPGDIDNLCKQEIIERLKHLEEIITSLDAAVYIHNLQTNHHVWTNNNYQKIIGYTAEEIGEMGIEEALKIYHPDDLEIIKKRIAYLKADKGKPYSGIYRIKHKEGHWVWVYCHASVFKRNKAGKPQLVLGLAIDFTERIQTEKQLDKLIKENRQLKDHILIQKLTKREREILEYIAKGLSCKEISKILQVSYFTAETHRKNISKKLKLKNTAAIVSFAVKHGLD